MGTIAEEITRIQTAKSNIKTAIENKGVAVGDITIDGYADKINQIVVGGETVYVQKFIVPQGLQCLNSTMTSIDVGSWDVSNMTSMNNLFYYCQSLVTINGIGSWDVSNVLEMQHMFYTCKNLTSLDLSSWITPTSCNFSNMFQNCSSLIDLNITSFDLSDGFSAAFLINGCTNLVNFNCGKNIKGNMFISSCASLSVDSIMSIINNYYDYTANGLSTTNTLYMSQAQADKLTDEQKAVLTNKGISFSIS